MKHRLKHRWETCGERGRTPQTKDLRFLQRRVYFFCMASHWKTYWHKCNWRDCMNICFCLNNENVLPAAKTVFVFPSNSREISGVSAVQCDIPTQKSKSKHPTFNFWYVGWCVVVLFLFLWFLYFVSGFLGLICVMGVSLLFNCLCVCLVVFLNQSKPNNTPNVIEIVFDFVWIWLCLCLCDMFAVEKISEQWLVESILYQCKFGVIIAIITIVIACSR